MTDTIDRLIRRIEGRQRATSQYSRNLASILMRLMAERLLKARQSKPTS